MVSKHPVSAVADIGSCVLLTELPLYYWSLVFYHYKRNLTPVISLFVFLTQWPRTSVFMLPYIFDVPFFTCSLGGYMSKGSGNEDAETIRTEDFVDRFQDTMVYSSGKLIATCYKTTLKDE